MQKTFDEELASLKCFGLNLSNIIYFMQIMV